MKDGTIVRRTLVEPSPQVRAIRRREVGQRPEAVERKLKADVEAWLKERRGAH
jgi:hypothetical protein